MAGRTLRVFPSTEWAHQFRHVTGKTRLTRKGSADPPDDATIAAQLARAFGRRFSRARIDAGLTREDIEARTGVSQDLLRQIEAGRADPTSTTLTALALAVEVPSAALLAWPSS